MADVQHKNLTDPQLHEPKGASSASANEVYVADGGGSGSWSGQNPSYAQGWEQGNTTATTISGTGAGNEVSVSFGGGFTSDLTNDFTIGSNGLFTYTGSETRTFFVTMSFNATQATASMVEYDFLWAKNGTIDEAAFVQVQTDGTNIHPLVVSGVFTLAQNDTLQLYVRNNTDTTDVTVQDASSQVIQLGF